jgi:hypothetical protein
MLVTTELEENTASYQLKVGLDLTYWRRLVVDSSMLPRSALVGSVDLDNAPRMRIAVVISRCSSHRTGFPELLDSRSRHLLPGIPWVVSLV